MENNVIYTISDNCLCIIDSYRVTKHDMIPELQKIHEETANSHVWNRKYKSLKNEWIVHNFLYNIHLFRSHTKDIDLNYPNKFEWIYNMLGTLVSIFIK